jgi:hypothetical protein
MKKKTAGKTKPMHRAGWTQRELRTDTNAHWFDCCPIIISRLISSKSEKIKSDILYSENSTDFNTI